jgi:(+)-trans-carveol dehydrogenase
VTSASAVGRVGRVENRVALVTGAARGMGRSIAVELAREGADVVVTDLCGQVGSVPYPMANDADLEETARFVVAAGRRCVVAPADVRDFGSLVAATQQGVDAFGTIDIVVANAGISSPSTSSIEIDETTWSEMIDINLTGVWRTCKAALPTMVQAGAGGAVVLVSSTAGVKGFPMMAHYVAAKHGVVGLMRTLAQEFAPERIRVNSVLPTSVNTPMLRNEATSRLFRPDLPSPTLDDAVEAFMDLNLLPTPWVEPVDVANAVLFLASDESRFITGAALPVDAGVLVK